jgi:hypothetical protein
MLGLLKSVLLADFFFFFFGKSIKWPPKLLVICNLVPQSFNWYKVAPKLPIPYNLAPSVRVNYENGRKIQNDVVLGCRITKVPSSK